MSDERPNISLNKRLTEILKEQSVPDPDEIGSPPGSREGGASVKDIRFDITPDELIRYLKQYIIGQDRAVEMVATKICTHFHRMQLERNVPELPRIIGNVKSNILLIGPTGVGKTYLIRLIANKLRVPFVKGDATKFSETGYVGGDVEDLVRELVYQVDGNIPLAEHGIIYIDEIDKIASSGSYYGPDVSRGGVQRNLLKLMEETEVDMKVPHDLASQMEAVMETQRTGKAVRKKVNTRNILFVMSGAFLDLPEIIARRLKKGGIGFTGVDFASVRQVDFLLSNLHASDLMEYGFESEFVGRLPVIAFMSDLTEDGLYNILKNLNSSVIQAKKRDFAAYGIELTFEDEAYRYIAREAHKRRTGARGLVSVVENLLLPFERSLPSTEIRRLNVSEALCANPQKHLTEILNQDAFRSYAEKFFQNTNIQLEFSSGAIKAALEIADKEGNDIREVLGARLKDYEYGLKLVGRDRFVVTRSVMTAPKEFLDRLVKQAYREGKSAGQ